MVRMKKTLNKVTAMIFVVILILFSISVDFKNVSALEQDLKIVSIKLNKNAESTNHHLLFEFNKRLSITDDYNQVNNEQVRAKILINGVSLYDYEAVNKISTQVYYNTNGKNTLRVNIPISAFGSIFASDKVSGEIINTEIKFLKGLKVETGDTLNKDVNFTYFALGEIFLGEDDPLSNHVTNAVSVHYYPYKKHLRLYFDAPVGDRGVNPGEPVSGIAREKILINGKSVSQRNLELYMNPNSITHNDEGNWYEYVDGKKVWGGANGFITSANMMRVSMSSSSGTYNLKLDGSDTIELLAGLKTANDKILTTNYTFKLPKENIGILDEDIDFLKKATNLVEADVSLSRGTNGMAELTLVSTSKFNPVDEIKSYTFLDMMTYFSKLTFNNKSFSQIDGLTAKSSLVAEESDKYKLVFTFPKDFVKFNGEDKFSIGGGFIYPNGNDAKIMEKTFINNPLSIDIEKTATSPVLNLKYTFNLGDKLGESDKILFNNTKIESDKMTIDKNILKIKMTSQLAHKDSLIIPSGTLDGQGNASQKEVEFIYNSDLKLFVAKNRSEDLIIEKVNALKNQDNGINTWLTIQFKNPVAFYDSYPKTLAGEDVNMYSNILLNNKPLIDLNKTDSNKGISVIWIDKNFLRVNIPSENTLIDFTKPLSFTLKNGFRTNLNFGLENDYSIKLEKYSERDGMWIEKFNEDGSMANENHNLKVTSIGVFGDEGANVSLSIIFNQSLANGYYPHANATAGFMSGLLTQFYSENDIKYFVYNGLSDRIRDSIILDGKSVWERMILEEGMAMNTQVMAHYGTVGANVLQIFINKNSQSKDVIDMTKEHILTIKSGFKTPNGGITAEEVSYKYNPNTRSWDLDGAESSPEIPIDKGEATYPIVGGGCGAISMPKDSFGGKATLIAIFSAVFYYTLKRKGVKNYEKN